MHTQNTCTVHVQIQYQMFFYVHQVKKKNIRELFLCLAHENQKLWAGQRKFMDVRRDGDCVLPSASI